MTQTQIVDISPDTSELLLVFRRANTVIGKGALGIDVSRWQGEVNWPAMAAAGVKFAGIRATMGTTGIDLRFARNWAGAKLAGIARFAYHYFINGLSGLAQFNNFRMVLGSDIGEMPPVCDVEPRNISTDPNVTVYETVDRIPNTAEILAWLVKCKEVLARDPLIYTNKFAWDWCTTVPAWSNQYGLWHAQHTTAPLPSVKLPWTSCAIWQYSASGNIGGTSPLDLDWYGPFL